VKPKSTRKNNWILSKRVKAFAVKSSGSGHCSLATVLNAARPFNDCIASNGWITASTELESVWHKLTHYYAHLPSGAKEQQEEPQKTSAAYETYTWDTLLREPGSLRDIHVRHVTAWASNKTDTRIFIMGGSTEVFLSKVGLFNRSSTHGYAGHLWFPELVKACFSHLHKQCSNEMQNSRFSQQRCWRFKCSKMWRRFDL
jgi:hypothetical protein